MDDLICISMTFHTHSLQMNTNKFVIVICLMNVSLLNKYKQIS